MSIPEGTEGIILERVMEALDEYYSEELKQKIIRGQYDNALQNKAVGGRIPFGYKTDENGKYILDEEKSFIAREIFSRYAAGEKAVAICEDLNKRGIRTSTGKEFSKNSLHGMFSNLKYIGVYSFTSADEDYKDIYNENGVPAIITKELFEKVQKRIEANKHKKSKKRLDNIVFLLSGKAYDGNCGGAFVGDSGTSKSGETYYYYTCQNKKQKKTCKTKSVRKEWFEDIVVEATRKIVFDDKLINYIGDWIIELQEKNIDNTMLKVAEKELQNVQSSIKNIMKAIEQGIITDTTKDRLLELEARQAQLENEVKIENLKITAPKVQKEQVIFWLEQFREGDANKESYKKEVIDTFVNTVVLHDDIITIAFNYSNNEIVDIPLSQLKNSPDSVRMSLLNWRLGDSNS